MRDRRDPEARRKRRVGLGFIQQVAFRVHPYHHEVIGDMADLLTMTRDDLYGYYRQWYVPNNASLVIVGDVDTDEALRRAEHHFGKIPGGAVPPRLKTVEPEQTGERRVTIYRYGPLWGATRFGYEYSQALLDRLTPERRKILQPVAPLRGPASQ